MQYFTWSFNLEWHYNHPTRHFNMKQILLFLTCGFLLTQPTLEAAYEKTPAKQTAQDTNIHYENGQKNHDSFHYDSNRQDCCEPAPCHQVVNDCCITYRFGAEWLYWMSTEDNLNYAAEVSTVTVGLENNIESRVLRPKFDYDSGLRIFAGMENQDWTLDWQITYMPASAGNTFDAITVPSPNLAVILSPNFPILTAVSNSSFELLTANWDSWVYYSDITLSNTYDFCSCIYLEPYMGLRALLLNQDMSFAGISGVASFDSTLNGKVAAGGLLGGLSTRWELSHGFSALADIGGSIMYATFRNKGIVHANDGVNSTIIQYKDRAQKCIMMFDGFLGVEYISHCFCYSPVLRAGYEMHKIYHTNEFSLQNAGAYTMEGFTLGGGISF